MSDQRFETRPHWTSPEYQEYVRWRRCEKKKHRFLSQSLAENYATLLCWMDSSMSGMTAYCCRFCGDWHIGHADAYKTKDSTDNGARQVVDGAAEEMLAVV